MLFNIVNTQRTKSLGTHKSSTDPSSPGFFSNANNLVFNQPTMTTIENQVVVNNIATGKTGRLRLVMWFMNKNDLCYSP